MKNEPEKIPEMPADYLIEDAARDADKTQRRFEGLEKRVRALESRGSLLPNIDEENVFFYLTVAYVVFAWVLPAAIRLFDRSGSSPE